MGEIKVTPEELRALAVKMQGSRDLAENLKNNVYRATEEIRNGTENSMADNISLKMNMINRKIGRLYEYIDKHTAFLYVIADEFEKDDHDLKLLQEANRKYKELYDGYLGKQLPGGKSNGQCTEYVKARMQYLGFPLHLCTRFYDDGWHYGNANRWLEFNENGQNSTLNCYRGCFKDNMDKLKFPCVCQISNGSSTGHVIVLEAVEYDANGKITNILYSEANGDDGVRNAWDSEDGVLKSLSFDAFVSKFDNGSGCKIDGFLCPV